jgi:transposase
MIDDSKYGSIRKCNSLGLSQRACSRLTGASRATVAKYWNGERTPFGRIGYPANLESPQRSELEAEIAAYLKSCEGRESKKQRVTARKVWEHVSHTRQVAYSTVAKRMKEMGRGRREGFIPLHFEPGEAMQADWTEAKIDIKGTRHSLPVFCAVLPYSFNIFAVVMPNMAMGCIVAAHIMAFEHFGGVPRKVHYDNLRTVAAGGYGKWARTNETFRKRVESHYCFESVFMNPDAGHEKGAVENLCGLVKRMALTPIPRAGSMDEAQALIAVNCARYCANHKIRWRKRSVAEMFAEERKSLLPLPGKRLDWYDSKEAKVGKDLTFAFEANKYSVPEEHVGRNIALKIYPYEIEALSAGKVIARHERLLGKEGKSYDPEHYLDLIVRKPRSIENAAPLKDGNLPPELAEFRELCQGRNKSEQLVEIMLMGREHDGDLLMRAVANANATRNPSASMVKTFLAICMIEGKCGPVPSFGIEDAGIPDLREYDSLIGQAGESDDESGESRKGGDDERIYEEE